MEKIDWKTLDKDWKLCYVKEVCNDEFQYVDRSCSLKLFYSKYEAEDVWGDDWDDPEYDSNAGTPYKFGVTIEGEYRSEVEVEYLVLDFVFHTAYVPNDFSDLKRVSVEDINKRKIVPWLIMPNKSLYAGSSPQDLKEVLEGERYLLDIDDEWEW